MPAMGDRLAGLWGLARVRWAQMAPQQRGWTAVAALLLAGMLGGLFWYGLRTDWRTLYTGLDPQDARQISVVLTQAHIPFDVAGAGGEILVPAADLDKARLATAAKGGVKSGKLGFEIFDKPNWVGSEFDEHVNYQRALEGELEQTIDTLSDVESARVNLVMPHDSLFRDQDRPAKASVMLKLRHRGLAPGEPEAIRNLVASAVDDLTPDRVVLVDDSGQLLGPKTPEALHLTAEEALEDKLIATLEPVTGPGNVRASVTLQYDDAATDVTQETYDPSQTVTLSMRRTEQLSGPKAIAAGVPGAASNAPNSQAVPVYPHETAPPQSATSEASTYASSKTIKHTVEDPGSVRRMTAAIIVNDRLARAASGKSPAVWEPRSAAEMRNLTALAQAAVGFDPARGDVLTVEDIPFEDNRAPAPVPLPEKFLKGAETSPLLVKYGALLLAILAVLVFGVRPALRRAGAAVAARAEDPGPPKELAASAAPPAIPSSLRTSLQAQPEISGPERARNQEIFDQVTAQLKREPTQSSRLLQSWIHSD